MEIVFIRHGQPDYTEVGKRGFIGHGTDLASLTNNGKLQALQVSKDSILDNVELIVSSPYTRALQTAAIISKQINVDIEIELDLHEWLPDLSFMCSSQAEASALAKLSFLNKGLCPEGCEVKYETLENVFNRTNNCLKKYCCYKKIAVVAHGIVIRQFKYQETIPFCGASLVQYNENFKWCGFVE